MKLKIVLEASEEGGYTVFVPILPGCVSEGDTKEEALANIREAIELHVEPVEDDIAQKTQIEAILEGIREADKDKFLTDQQVQEALLKWGVDEVRKRHKEQPKRGNSMKHHRES